MKFFSRHNSQHTDFVIAGGRVVVPSNSTAAELDVLVKDGKVEAVDKPGSFVDLKIKTLDAKGKIVSPGFVDIHVHLREPGFEWKETIHTGSRAAVAGGFTSIACMPNTKPVNDTAQVTNYILEKAAQSGLSRVFPIGAITVGSKGEQLAPFQELQQAGCVAFSDDGNPVQNPLIMRRALEYCRMLDAVLTVHEEEKSLSRDFSVNEGNLSLKLGLVGMPGAAEDIMIARDIELARLTGGKVHFCHVSTARSVVLIRRAKEDGINVTAETAPHYFSLDENSVGEFDTKFKMSMPLRTLEDIEGIIAGLADGTLDCIASDHAPHDRDSKLVEFDRASFGVTGLQTMLPLTFELVATKKISLIRAISALSINASKCLGLPVRDLLPGNEADICIFDPEAKWVLDGKSNFSKSENSPFWNKELKGRVDCAIVGGKIVFSSSTTCK